MQRYTVYFTCKLLYMFRMVPPPIIRGANISIYSIWYMSHRYCYLPLSWKSWNWFECAAGGVRLREYGAEENMMTWEEVNENWRKLHNEELHDSSSVLNIFRMRKLARYVACMGEKKNIYRDLVGWDEWKTGWRIWASVRASYSTGSWRCGKGALDWTNLAQDTERRRELVKAVLKLRIL